MSIANATPQPEEELVAPSESAARLSDAESRELAWQVGALSAGRLPLSEGLKALGDELPQRRPRSLLRALAADLERGKSLPEAIDARGRRFPAELKGLLSTAARDERLAALLGRFLEITGLRQELRWKLWLSLIYPALLVTLACALFGLIAQLTAQAFASTFEDFGIAIPAVTLAVLQVGRVLADAGWWVVVGPVVGMLLVVLASRVVFGAAERRRMINGLPLVGPLWRQAGLAECCRILSLLIKNETPLPEALRLTSESVLDADLSASCARLADEVAAGRSLGEAIEKERAFPDGYAEFLQWAEGHRGLDEALGLSAEMAEAKARAQSNFVSTFFIAIALVSVVWLVGVVFVALIVPLMILLNSLSWGGPGPATNAMSEGLVLALGLGGIAGAVVLFVFVWTLLRRARARLLIRTRDGLSDSIAKRAAPSKPARPWWIPQLGLRHLMFSMVLVAMGLVLAKNFGFSIFGLMAALAPPVVVVGTLLFLTDRRSVEQEGLVRVMAAAAREQMPLGPAIVAFSRMGRGLHGLETAAFGTLLGRGVSLPAALDVLPGVLPFEARVLARTGWASGTLPLSLHEAVALKRLPKRMTMQVFGYPLLVLFALTASAVFMGWFILPRYQQIFREFTTNHTFTPARVGESDPGELGGQRIEMPAVTRALIAFNDWVGTNAPLITIAILVSVLLLCAVFVVRRRLAMIPLLDWIFLRKHSALLLRSLAAGVDAGEPLPAVTARVAGSYPRPWMKRRLTLATDDMLRGNEWVASLRKQNLIRPADAALLASAQKVGNLAWALRQAAASCERRLVYQFQNLRQLLQPAIILMLALIVFIYAAAYFMPLITLIEAMAEAAQ